MLVYFQVQNMLYIGKTGVIWLLQIRTRDCNDLNVFLSKIKHVFILTRFFIITIESNQAIEVLTFKFLTYKLLTIIEHGPAKI